MAGITILDGGLGQELVARSGHQPGPLWATELMMKFPGLVGEVHKAYFDAGADIATAAVRAAVQLGLITLIITAVLGHIVWSWAFVAMMFAVAVFTSARRSGIGRGWWWIAVDLAAGVVPVLGVIFSSGVVPLSGAAVVPMAGIIIGGTMTAHTLAVRRCLSGLSDEVGQLEAGVSIGLLPDQAAGLVIRSRLPEGLIPGLDQTRTVGLVMLPGAFVGVLLGGGSLLQAGAAQLIVLVGQLASGTIAVAVAGRNICAGRLLQLLPSRTVARGRPPAPA